MVQEKRVRRVLGLRRGPGLGRALGLALLVHAVLLTALVVSFRWSRTPQKVIRATVVQETERKADDTASRRREEERRRQEEARAKAEQQEAKRHEQEAAKRKADAEARKQAEEAKQRAVAEAKRKKEAAKRRQQEAERSLKEQLASEERQRAEAKRKQEEAAALEQKLASARNQYEPVIRQKVERNWTPLPGIGKGLSCTVRVRLVAGGEVIGASVTRSSGNARFDRSAENAVYKASPLPVPADPDVFSQDFQEFDFEFKPEE
jgi:colicin import membrane protein